MRCRPEGWPARVASSIDGTPDFWNSSSGRATATLVGPYRIQVLTSCASGGFHAPGSGRRFLVVGDPALAMGRSMDIL